MKNYTNDAIKTSDLMQILGIGRNKAYALMHAQNFPSIRLGHTYIVMSADLDKWLQSRKGKEFVLQR